jgi:heme A synthase
MVEPAQPVRRRTGATRALLAIAALLLAAYAVNIGLGVADVKLHARAWRLGDVGEFLLVLFAMAFFVAGLMLDEQAPAASGDETAGPLSSEGGEP